MGHSSSLNKGAASIINSMLRTLNEKIPDAEFTILSANPELDSTRYEAKMLTDLSTPSKLGFSMLRYFIWVILYLFRIETDLLVRPYEKETLHAYSEADIILVNGGDILRELAKTPWEMRYLGCLCFILLSKLLKKPVVIYAHTIGPFRGRWSELLTSYILSMTDLLMVRDEVSKRYLSKIGVSKPRIYLTADPAFLLEAVPATRGQEILLAEGITPTGKPLIGVQIASTTVSYGFPELKSREEKWEKYVKILTKMIDHLTARLNSVVILVPHQFGPGRKSDDRVINQAVYQRVIDKRRVKLINNEYSPEELKRIIGQFDLFISTGRHHPIIHAISMNVPSLGVDYDHKIGALMEMLGQEKYVCQFGTLSLDGLKTKIDDAYSARDLTKAELKSGVEILEERARLNAKLVNALLKKAGTCRPLSALTILKGSSMIFLARFFN